MMQEKINYVSPRIHNRLMSLFIAFFHHHPGTSLRVDDLGITDLYAEYTKDERNQDIIELFVTLTRPGLLIGESGTTIDALTEYFNNIGPNPLDNPDKEPNLPIKITIIESDLWRHKPIK